MADGEKTPSENFRKKQSCLSDGEDSENEEAPRLNLGAKHGKKREIPANHLGSSGPSSK